MGWIVNIPKTWKCTIYFKHTTPNLIISLIQVLKMNKEKFHKDEEMFYQSIVKSLIQNLLDKGHIIQSFHIYTIYKCQMNLDALMHLEKFYIKMLYDHRSDSNFSISILYLEIFSLFWSTQILLLLGYAKLNRINIIYNSSIKSLY